MTLLTLEFMFFNIANKGKIYKSDKEIRDVKHTHTHTHTLSSVTVNTFALPFHRSVPC